MRLIKKDDLIAFIKSNGFVYANTLETFPEVDAVEVVHGEWIYDSGDEYADHYHCSVCGEKIDLCNEIFTEMKLKYCPNCGAKMGKCREGEASE